MSGENISSFHSVLDEALERLGKKNLKLKECQYEAVKAVVVDRKDTIRILPTGYGKSLTVPASSLLRLIESIYLQRMRSTGDIQFFVCRPRIIPEPPFPSQGIAGSGNEIGAQHTILDVPRTSLSRELCMVEISICKRLSDVRFPVAVIKRVQFKCRGGQFSAFIPCGDHLKMAKQL